VSFAAINLCIASQRVFIVVSMSFVIDSVRKLLDTPSYWGENRSTIKRNTGALLEAGKEVGLEIHVKIIKYVVHFAP
jgi:hypothetical protein